MAVRKASGFFAAVILPPSTGCRALPGASPEIMASSVQRLGAHWAYAVHPDDLFDTLSLTRLPSIRLHSPGDVDGAALTLAAINAARTICPRIYLPTRPTRKLTRPIP